MFLNKSQRNWSNYLWPWRVRIVTRKSQKENLTFKFASPLLFIEQKSKKNFLKQKKLFLKKTLKEIRFPNFNHSQPWMGFEVGPSLSISPSQAANPRPFVDRPLVSCCEKDKARPQTVSVGGNAKGRWRPRRLEGDRSKPEGQPDVKVKMKTTRYRLGCLEVEKSFFVILKHPSSLL